MPFGDAIDTVRPEPDRDRGQIQPGRLLEQPDARLVITVDHRTAGVFRGEQLGLGREVIGDRVVELQVVAAEVGEADDVELDAGHPPQRERVRADLHGHRVCATVAHHGEHRLQVGRLRGGDGGAVEMQRLTTEQEAERPDTADAASGPVQRGRQHQHGGRLAVGAGDPEARQPARWVIVEAAGRERHRGARIVGHGDRQRHVTGEPRALGVGEQGDRAGGLSGGGEGTAMALRPGQAHIEVTGTHPAGVEDNTSDRRVLRRQPDGQPA